MAFSAAGFQLEKAHLASPAIARMATIKTGALSSPNGRLFRIILFSLSTIGSFCGALVQSRFRAKKFERNADESNAFFR
jgi:hypothetical protein